MATNFKELRIKQAVGELSTKETNNYDKSKNFVICSECIEDGLPIGKKTFTYRRDKLGKHIHNCHGLFQGAKLYEFNQLSP